MNLGSFSFHSFGSCYTFVLYESTTLNKALKLNKITLYQNAIGSVSKCHHMQIMLQHIEVPCAQQEFSRKQKSCKWNKFDEKQNDFHTLGPIPVLEGISSTDIFYMKDK